MQERRLRTQQIRERHVHHTERVVGMLQRIREMRAEDMDRMERIVGAMHSMARTQGGEARSRGAVR